MRHSLVSIEDIVEEMPVEDRRERLAVALNERAAQVSTDPIVAEVESLSVLEEKVIDRRRRRIVSVVAVVDERVRLKVDVRRAFTGGDVPQHALLITQEDVVGYLMDDFTCG